MNHFSIRFIQLLSAFILIFFINGCTNTTAHFTDPDDELSLQEQSENALEEVETEENLQLELEALEQTGNWEEGTQLDSTTEPEIIQYDFPVVINKQVQMYLDFFQNKHRKHFAQWLARSGRYLPMIHRELEEAGLPLDLAYLAMIESGFNQRAYSRARAVGLWQFIKGTGRLYRLKIDNYVDERRDAEKSTRAAIAFLSDLYDTFGDWYLAVAAYNAGPGKISRGLKKYRSNDFWQLAKHRYLKLETKRYVPKLIAAIIIAKEPEKYGFSSVQTESPMSYDILEAGPGLDLRAVALISDGDFNEIKQLNMELRKGMTPANKARYEVKIPPGTQKLAQQNLRRLHRIVSTDYKTHIIKKGDTLTKICRRYKINKTTLLKVNNIQQNQLIAGKHLRIPYRTIRYQLLATNQQGAIIDSKDDLVLHSIQPGDTISKIAKKYNVPAEMIVAWNGLESIHKIRAGHQLSLYIDQQHPFPVKTGKNIARSARHKKHDSPDNTITLAGKKKRPVSRSSSIQGVKWYVVKSGDSLWTISRKFKVSTAQIKKWNNLKSNLIQPGNRLKLINV